MKPEEMLNLAEMLHKTKGEPLPVLSGMNLADTDTWTNTDIGDNSDYTICVIGNVSRKPSVPAF